MSSFFAKLMRSSSRHVADGDLLRMMDGELSASQQQSVQKHLERCWTCRARREHLEKAIVNFVDYRAELLAPFLPPPPGARDRYFAKRNALLAEAKASSWGTARQNFRFVLRPAMNPILTSALIIFVAISALFLVWQRHVPTVSASELLDRATAWDAPSSPNPPPGVIYQKVQIRDGANVLDRAIYRDAEGKRRARPDAQENSEAQWKRKRGAATN